MPFAIIPSEEISHRCDFSLLCNARGYKDAVEVGVDQGVFAAEFLRRFSGHWLFCIDPYDPYPEFPHDRKADLFVAIQALMPFHGRFRLVTTTSLEAVKWISTLISPEFVYLDASHEEADIAADLKAWWDVLSPHGMLAGHDHDPSHPGVTRAVESFARERGLVVRLTHETSAQPSFYIYRSEPETLFYRLFRSGESPNPFAGEGPHA